MESAAFAGIVLLILIGIGCIIGIALAVVSLGRLHTAAQAEHDRMERARIAREVTDQDRAAA